MRAPTRAACRIVLCAWILVCAPAAAEEEPAPEAKLTPEALAAQVADAAADGDDEALATLAKRYRPDPWLTARVLLVEGRTGPAQAFAAAVPEGRRGGLVEEVGAWRDAPEPPAIVQRLDAARAALAGNRPAAAREAIEGLEPIRESPRALAAWVRARCHVLERNAKTALPAFERAHEHAKAVRWPTLTTEAALGAARMNRTSSAWEEGITWFGVAAAGVRTSHDLAFQLMVEREQAQCLYDGERIQEALAAARAVAARAREARLRLEELQAENLVGRVLAVAGGYSEALDHHTRGLALARELEERGWEVSELMNLGRNLMSLSRVDEAEARFLEALSRVEEPERNPKYGDVLRHLGVVDQRRGNTARALERINEALAIARRHEDRLREAWCLHALGGALMIVRDFQGAREAFEKSVHIKLELGRSGDAAQSMNALSWAQRLGGDLAAALQTIDLSIAFHRESGGIHALAHAMLHRAFIHIGAGKLDLAQKDLEEALKLKRQVKDVHGVASALVGLGHIHEQAGRYEEALPLYEQARVEFVAIGAAPQIAQMDQNLAELHERRKAWKKAIAAADLALEGVRLLQHGLADRDAIGLRRPYVPVYLVGLRAAIKQGDVAAAFRMLESGRAGALLQALGGRDALDATLLPQDAVSTARAARERIAQARRRAAAALSRGEVTAAAKAREDLHAAEAALRAAIARIQTEAPGAADVSYPRAMPLAELQARLAADEAYVAYEVRQKWAVALVVTKREARVVRLLDPRRLRSIVKRARFDAPPTLNQQAITMVRGLLLGPLRLPKGMRRLVLSPSGFLTNVPFAALLPDTEVAYVPSATTWQLLREDCVRCGKGSLAIGDPEYPEDARVAGVPLDPLPHTRPEAVAIGDVVLLGKQATIPAFAAALKQRPAWSAIHLACHAVMDPRRARDSALALTPTADDDGLLRVRDVFGMKIESDLVVLSACESGIGAIESAEGLIGFTRAFMYAGAPRVLVSLWRVDDKATSALMKKLYEIWRTPVDGERPTTTAALQQAQAWLRSHEQWRHPYYWAAWSLWGPAE